MMDFCTSYLWLNLIIFVVGSWMLIKGSDLFVDAAAGIARYWNVSELVIGLTLVSIGTSLPELSTSICAAFYGESDFVIGNVVGSITTNITLILGAAVLIGGKMDFPPKLLSRDVVLMNAVFLLTFFMFYFTRVQGPDESSVYGINRISGMFLLICSFFYCYHLFKHPDELEKELEELPKEDDVSKSPRILIKLFLLLFLGLVMITAGSKAMVDTVVWGAVRLKIDTLVISATIVAFGTSVPELAVTIAGILKGRNDLAIGNIIGSCIFNIFLIFGICALICPLGIDSPAGLMNVIWIVPSGLLLMLFMYTGRVLTRIEGAALLLIYCGFLVYNVYHL